MSAVIRFPDVPPKDLWDYKSLAIPVDVDGEYVTCRVTYDAVTNQLGSDASAAKEAFAARRAAIEAVATGLIEQGLIAEKTLVISLAEMRPR